MRCSECGRSRLFEVDREKPPPINPGNPFHALMVLELGVQKLRELLVKGPGPVDDRIALKAQTNVETISIALDFWLDRILH